MDTQTIAVMMPGDMGHGVGRALVESGHDAVTCLAGRSERTRALAETGKLRDVPDLDTLVTEAEMVLSILPPAAALAQAEAIAGAMVRTGRHPAYVDCNAVAPDTALQVGAVIEAAGAPFIDAGIIGLAPGKDIPRFYVSGTDTGPMEALDGCGFKVVAIGSETGKASGLKMCYAGLTKGTWTLHTAVLLAAEAMGLSRELKGEFLFSQQSDYKKMEARVPRLPADSERWVGEMEQIAKAFSDAGVTSGFHDGAAEIFRLLARTPFAAETRQNFDESRGLEESVRVYAEHLETSKNE